MTVINLRGTNGAGKSTIVRGLLAASSKHRKIYGLLGTRQAEANELIIPGVARPVYVLGPYLNGVGGCDRILPYANIIKLLDQYNPKGHVVFEGVLISDNYGKIGDWLEAFGKEAVVAFLDTPYEVCLENINKRADGKGSTKNVEKKFKRIQIVRGWFLKNGRVRVEDISMDNGLDRVLALLRAKK